MHPSFGYAVPYVPQRKDANGLCTAAMWLGIVGLALPWVSWVPVAVLPDSATDLATHVMAVLVGLGPLAAVVAIVLGSVGMRRASRGLATNRGAAIAGLVCGIVGLVQAVLAVVVVFMMFAAMGTF